MMKEVILGNKCPMHGPLDGLSSEISLACMRYTALEEYQHCTMPQPSSQLSSDIDSVVTYIWKRYCTHHHCTRSRYHVFCSYLSYLSRKEQSSSLLFLDQPCKSSVPHRHEAAPQHPWQHVRDRHIWPESTLCACCSAAATTVDTVVIQCYHHRNRGFRQATDWFQVCGHLESAASVLQALYRSYIGAWPVYGHLKFVE